MDKVEERISKLGDSFRQIIQTEAQRERRDEIEKKKRTSFAEIQMDFEIVMLSEVTQKEKDECK